MSSKNNFEEEVKPRSPTPSLEGEGVPQTPLPSVDCPSPSVNPVVSEPVIHHRTPTVTKCPNCEVEVVSNVRYRNGMCVWLSCAGCAAIGGILGCCLIPLFVKSFKDVEHSCPHCCYRLGVCKAL
ncbi:lipopolysaccharide induced transcription factor [Echinococcus multilocularis]|uniref:Lipopolysaccharide induced transcription factor n=1 Tax=Echinococcus multilocularis TaxID=6211 RepID=A0A068YE64_ECHMU|nr:lipopolysaccharide induced transcription factor [Echinococcus multilocularis]